MANENESAEEKAYPRYTPLEVTSAVTAVANALACKLSTNELTLLAAVLVQLGDTLATIAAVRNE